MGNFSALGPQFYELLCFFLYGVQHWESAKTFWDIARVQVLSPGHVSCPHQMRFLFFVRGEFQNSGMRGHVCHSGRIPSIPQVTRYIFPLLCGTCWKCIGKIHHRDNTWCAMVGKQPCFFDMGFSGDWSTVWWWWYWYSVLLMVMVLVHCGGDGDGTGTVW